MGAVDVADAVAVMETISIPILCRMSLDFTCTVEPFSFSFNCALNQFETCGIHKR